MISEPNPFTMPLAVGGYNVPGKPRWRRPVTENDDLQGEAASPVPLEDPFFRKQVQCVPPAVKLYDLARGMPRRIEAQYRRHWSCVPSLWNLYFREQLNLGMSLSATSRGKRAELLDDVEQDVAMAAAKLYEQLEQGYYRDQNQKRHRITGDMSKLRFAEGITPQQKQILADVRFRTRNLPGTL